jgi:hypothetical protein
MPREYADAMLGFQRGNIDESKPDRRRRVHDRYATSRIGGLGRCSHCGTVRPGDALTVAKLIYVRSTDVDNREQYRNDRAG